MSARDDERRRAITVAKLIIELEKIKKNHGARTEVVFEKASLIRSIPECSHSGIEELVVECIEWMVDESTERSDGSTRVKNVCILRAGL